MKSRILLVPLFFMLIFSCSKSKRINLVEKNFGDEIPQNTVLSFTFDKDLVPDSLADVWSDIQYIDFSPEVKGKFHWQTTKMLVFAPEKGFDPATDYTCTLTDKIFKFAKKLSYSGDKEFKFHTPYLNIISSRAYWDIKDNEQAEPHIRAELEFNYPVKAQDVADVTEITVDNKKAGFAVATSENNSSVAFVITGVKSEDKDYVLQLKVGKGLTPVDGSQKTDKEFTENVTIPSPFKLNIVDLQASHNGSEGVVTIYTTQQVDADQLKNYIKISPAVKYKTEIQPGYFVIRSEDFSMDTKYDLTIKKGLKGKIGGELKYDYTQPISFGEVKPTIRFVNQKEFYVSGKGSRNIQVAILNVPKVKVRVTKIYENNILSYLRANNNSDYDDEDYYYDDYYSSNTNDIGSLGDVIYEKDIDTKDLPRQGMNRILRLDFEDKLSDNKGMYVVEVKSTNDYWLSDAKFLAISDIGLIVKVGKNSITVFANSIKTAEPLSDVDIKFIGANNQVTYSGKTDKDGVLTYNYDQLKAPGFRTTLITAQTDGDFNAIPLSKTEVNTSRFDVGGSWPNPAGLQTFIYGDRDLYRPGETINISAIVRDYKWKSPGTIPLVLKLVNPQGKNFKTLKKVLNDYGSFEAQIALPSSAVTGSYTANVYTTNNVLIGSEVIKVEEFMPDRIKVTVNMDKKTYKPGDKMVVGVEAVNFFGPPAANRNYEIEATVQRVNFYPKENRGYNYYIEGAYDAFSKDHREGKTDDKGDASESFDIPTEYKNMGILRYSIFSTVFDETGRPVNRLKNVNVYTQDVFYGIHINDYYMNTGQPAKIQLIAVDKDGKALSNVDAEVQLIKHEYKTVLSKSGSYFRYRSEKVERVLERKKMKLNGTASFYSFIPDLSGEYELRISAPGVHTYVSSEFYAYGWGSTSYSSFKVNNEGQIDIQLDKKKYNVGDKAKVLLKTPFSGKVLVTVEREKVMDYFYVNTDKRAASFDIDLKEGYIPNVYITATLFKPHNVSDIPLTVAHGFAPVIVENPDYKIPVTISAVKTSRSNTKQTIKVKGKPNSPITIAVVDEGILQLAGYATPDPYGFYYQKRALQVNSYDVYPYLFPELGMVRSQTGGDQSEMAKRVNPFQNNRVKLVSFWSGILLTNSRGEAEYNIDIPQFSGSLRIMAVNYNGQAFGSGQADIKVADPLVLSVALPRFLSPGDKLDVPVIMTNTTDKTARCKATLKVDGPLKIVGDKNMSASINAGKEGEVIYQLEALKEIGPASVNVSVNALGEKFENKTDITVRPASTLQKRTGSGSLAANKSMKLDIKTGDFIPSSVESKLVISKNPLVQFSKSLDYLVRYPYGCVEQTVSTAFPQLYYGQLVNTMFGQNKRASMDAGKNVQYALDKIKLMQLYDGGLTYWPGGGSESWWGSVYAAHFAIEAKKAGYDVDESFLNGLLSYLKSKLREKTTFTYYFNFNQKKVIAPQEVAYSLYVLTLAGEKPTALMNYYRSHSDELCIQSKYLLAGAYALTGDKQKYKEIVPGGFDNEKPNSSFGGSFYSYIRDEAIALNVLLEVDPDNPQVGVMAKHISEKLKTQTYLNTQERTWGFLAMGKIAKLAAESNIKGNLKADGKIISSFDNNTVVLKTDQINGKSLELSATGTGKVYYFWESEGISKDGSYQEEDSYIKVRKSFYNRNGALVTSNTFEQNDLVLVELAVTGLTDTYVENVVVTDLLPACFEIENPRLTDLPPGMHWPHNKSYPDYQDVRDDRINLFTDVSSTTRYYYYLVRVVSTGTYNMGPVSADAMYNGEYHSYNGAGVIKAVRKQ